MSLTPSPFITGFIKGFEQCRLKAYLPTPDDVPTIGWGSTGPDIRLGMTWTQAQADTRFLSDLNKVANTVNAVTKLPSQYQFDAFVSLAYNIGLAAFKSSTALRLHNIKDYSGAANAILLWNKQAGKVLNGLVTRRAKEREIYLGNLSYAGS